MKKTLRDFFLNRYAGYVLLTVPFLLAVIFMILHKSPVILSDKLKTILTGFFTFWLIGSYFYFGARVIVTAQEEGAWYWMKKLFVFHGNVVMYIVIFGLSCCWVIYPLVNYFYKW